jgi:hypothetical protein
VPASERADVLALIKAINLQYGVTEGNPRNHSWCGVVYDGLYWQIIVNFINS